MKAVRLERGRPVGRIFLILFCAGFALSAQQKEAPPPAPAPYVIPEEAIKRQSPLKAGEKSIAVGRRLYAIECAMCHGDDGSGKTELADSMQLALLDLRNPVTTKDQTDGALFYIILKGKGKMPPEEGRMKEAQIWQLVNFTRSMVKKEAQSAPKNP